MMVHPLRLRPLGERLVVKAYERPPMVGSLFLPQSHARDATGTVWEVVVASKGATKRLGFPPREGDIIKTRPCWPPSAGEDERDGKTLFFLEASEVTGVVVWAGEDDRPTEEEGAENVTHKE